MFRGIGVGIVAAASALAMGGTARADVVRNDRGAGFVPHPVSQAVYDLKPPSADPAHQRTFVRTEDGTKIFVEVWLPTAKPGGPRPPARIPVVIDYSPYFSLGALSPLYTAGRPLIRSGYAWAQVHVRGTGESGGCVTQNGPNEPRDAIPALKWLAAQPWSSGRLGAYGISYDGGTAVALASQDDPVVRSHLKAIVAMSPNTNLYDMLHQDGVSEFIGPAATPTYYAGQGVQNTVGDGPATAALPERFGCIPAQTAANVPFLDGGFSPYYAERDAKAKVDLIRAPVLYSHGTVDVRVNTRQALGWFDRIQSFHRAVIGVWNHDEPSDFSFKPSEAYRKPWERADWNDMVVTWFDRFLKRHHGTGVTRWPAVQIQGTDGQWRAGDNWPHPSGGDGRLALGDAGVLGATRPTGDTSYENFGFETVDHGDVIPGSAAQWITTPLADRLELTGAPVLDTWVKTTSAATNVTVRLEPLGPDGRPTLPDARDTGARSLRYLAPFQDERFVQATPVDPPVGTPIHVQIRLNPTDLVVPKGGRLRLTVAGSEIIYDGLDAIAPGAGAGVAGPSTPNLAPGTTTILHDCAHPTILRFTTPSPSATLLDVREPGQTTVGADPHASLGATDGGGLATAPICGS